MNTTKRIVLSVMVTGFLLLLVEVGLRCIYYQRNSGHAAAIIAYGQKLRARLLAAHRTTTYDKHMFKSDPLLGYSCIPGRYHITLTGGTWPRIRKYGFEAVLGPDGYRTTAADPSTNRGKPEIWIFGCSYTWGWPLDNQDTFPWLMQAELPKYRVLNYGVNGYGTVHALIQLRALLASNPPPATVVIVYNPFHLVRNVAAPSRLAEFRVMNVLEKYQHPKAFLDDRGKLQLTMVPIMATAGSDPPVEYMQRVTEAILAEIRELCAAKGIRPVFAYQGGRSYDTIVTFAQRNGFTVCDDTVDLSPEHVCIPFDSHPNAKAHRIYAEKLVRCLESGEPR